MSTKTSSVSTNRTAISKELSSQAKTASSLYERRPTRQSIIEAVTNIETELEKVIVEAENPIDIDHAEEVILNDEEKGYWINKEEIENWKGPIPIEEYRLNQDPDPIVVKKKPAEKLKYKQEVHIKYLKPPTPKPSEIIVIQEPNKQLPPAPPLVIRTAATPAPTPEPIIIREAPPPEPCPTPRKIIVVPGKVLPPPARKIIYEKMPDPPQKPQKVIIERWLKPKTPKPKIIYCKQVEQPRCQTCEFVDPCQQYQQFHAHSQYPEQAFNQSVAILPGQQPQAASHYSNENTYTKREYIYDIYL